MSFDVVEYRRSHALFLNHSTANWSWNRGDFGQDHTTELYSLYKYFKFEDSA